MAIDTTASTFEYTRDWLLSSNAFLYDAMGSTEPELDAAREQVSARIHREEAFQEPNEEAADGPDIPPPVDGRPLALVVTEEDSRTEVGTQSWAGRGTVIIVIEVIVPEAYRTLHDGDQTAAEKAARFKLRKEWGTRLCNTIRNELKVTKGRADGAGNPYLNARDINIKTYPNDPEHEEPQNYIGWEYEVPWIG